MYIYFYTLRETTTLNFRDTTNLGLKKQNEISRFIYLALCNTQNKIQQPIVKLSKTNTTWKFRASKYEHNYRPPRFRARQSLIM